MSEAPPDKPTEASEEKKPDVPPAEPVNVASTDVKAAPAETAKAAPAEPEKEAPAPAASALSDAAKAMDAAEKKAESAPPVAATAPTPPAITPSPAANTSGMHLQYVAPGVRRQSFVDSNRGLIVALSVMVTVMILMMFRGGIGGEMPGESGGGGGLPGPTPTPTALADQPPTDDTSYQPLANRMTMPAADLTVNAGAIGGSNPTTVTTHGDAGANKGGYKDERADLDIAEAMVLKDPDKALALVDKHDRDYPRGILDPDARIIRIEAFQKKGDDAKALALSDEFLQDYPHSPRAGRVQSITEQIKNKTGGGGGGGTANGTP